MSDEAAAHTIIDAERAPDRLQAAVERLARRKKIPHVILGVATSDDSFRWTGAAGPADSSGAAVQPDSPYFVASVTKLYIATAVLQLVERNRVDLDEPMLTYLPEDRVGGIHRTGDEDHTPEITVRHLISHTSGLPDYLEDAPRGGESMYRRLSRGEDQAWNFDEAVRIVREDLTPHFSPRTLGDKPVRARYSDTNFQLLIAIVEAVTGQAIHEVFTERILEPLGLGQTYLPGHSEPSQPASARAAGLWAKDRQLDLPGAMGSFNDLYSTTDDTLRFMQALVSGELFDDPGTFELMRQRWNPIFYPIHYGLGLMKFRIGRLVAPGTKPVTLIGHAGATGSWLFHCPELDVIMSGTVDEVDARRIPFRFMARVLRAACK